MEQSQEQDHAVRAAVVAPTYNNERTVGPIVTRLAETGLRVFVVDDGSSDDTPEILERAAREHGIQIVRHERNRGKAGALQSGFAAAAGGGFTHAITIDTDGQLNPDEAPQLLAAAEKWPAALIVGVRDETAEDYPARSRAGRRISNLLVRLESGVRVSDSQCGFRVYPLALIEHVRCKAGHFGFETEVIARAGWAGCEIREVPVTCRYFPPADRVSHFRPWVDSFRAIAMHARLLGRAILPWPHRKLGDGREKNPSRWRRLIDWISPARAWRELRDQPSGPQEMAAGLALGVFIGNLPVYGLHTILSLYAARRLHLNPISVVAGSHVSTPPLGPVLVAVAIGIGHWLIHGAWLQLPAWQQTWREWLRLSGSLLIDWSVGAIVVGAVLAAITFLVANVILRYAAVARR